MDIKSLINYDPETGRMTWAVDFMAGVHTRRAGDTVTMRKDSWGHLHFRALGVVYNAAQTAWEIYHGTAIPDGMLIDHKNCDKTDNRIENLRLATPLQNAQNASLRKDSRTGIKGVRFIEKTGRYMARVCNDGKRVFLGTFDTAEAAGFAAEQFRQRHHREFANSGN